MIDRGMVGMPGIIGVDGFRVLFPVPQHGIHRISLQESNI
jgi:hypothetical protein